MKVIATVAPAGGANDKLALAQTRTLVGEGEGYEDAKAAALAQRPEGCRVLHVRRDLSPMAYR
ncbi:hypothetical protein C6401_15120 [Arthrobacter woluwensis]|nr:hypothetical protein C6401_15120 [Arthrobacter woluwensis]